MIQQFEINSFVKRQLSAYLEAHNTDIQAAMQNEAHNTAIAAILHAGFPKMVQKIYSLPKFTAFFWEKRELLAIHLHNRLTATDTKKRR